MEPIAKLAGETGVTTIEDSVGPGVVEAVTGFGIATVNMMALVTPDTDAVILVVPAATPIAKPAEDIVALVMSELAHSAWCLIFKMVFRLENDCIILFLPAVDGGTSPG